MSRSPTLIFLDPALELARRNVGEAGLSERIELRRQDIREITDAAAFDLVWLPGPFLQRDVLEVSLARVTTALRPGGWVVLGLYGGQDELGAALARLRTVRSGGTALGNDEAVALLESAGLVGVEALTANVGVPVTDVVGRRPGQNLDERVLAGELALAVGALSRGARQVAPRTPSDDGVVVGVGRAEHAELAVHGSAVSGLSSSISRASRCLTVSVLVRPRR